MNNVNCLNPKFYTIEGLAHTWGCATSLIINLAKTGQIKLSLLTDDWWLDCGDVEGDGAGLQYIPEEYQRSIGEVRALTADSQRRLLRFGEMTNPSFVDPNFSYVSIDLLSHPDGIKAYISDIVISRQEAEQSAGIIEDLLDGQDDRPKPASPSTAVGMTEEIYLEGLRVLHELDAKEGSIPLIKTVVAHIRSREKFSRFKEGTIRRHLNKQELLERFRSEKA